MQAKFITASACMKIVEAATQSCQAPAQNPAAANISTGDGLASLSTAFTYASLLLGVIAVLGAVGWGIVVKVWAEKEARESAEKEVPKWLQSEALPLLRREASQFSQTFSKDDPISSFDADAMAEAAGEGRREG